MKIEQIAFAAQNPQQIIAQYSALGIDEWSHDVVKAKGHVMGVKCTNVAELHFNYQLGYELEILKYREGINWHQHRNFFAEPIFLSHKGVHVNDKELAEWTAKMHRSGIKIIQEVKTKSHTNPVIAGKRTYHYVIFDSIVQLGFDLKLIRRIDV